MNFGIAAATTCASKPGPEAPFSEVEQHIPDNSQFNPAGAHPATAEGKSRVIREVRGQAHKAGALEGKPVTPNRDGACDITSSQGMKMKLMSRL